MIQITIILGWVGIALFITLAATFQGLAKRNEFGFIHLIMAFMYAMWLPLPLALGESLNEEFLIVGTIFGEVYLIMIIITMTLQTGHLVHSAKQENDKELWEERVDWMMDTLTSPYEVLANIFKSVWAIFLAVAFWNESNMFMGSLMSLFSLLIVYFFIILLNSSLVHPIKFLSKVKPNPFIFNLETILFFLSLMIYITFYLDSL
ncbi:hypothetical protein LG329_14435 [Virgibacillus necropolis]|uniref:hypothetical protein n=1 Tax=Virgibacillus necropolis TaxID=163877 RepID=UPI00384D28B3